MLYKPEIKDITEDKEHFENYMYDAIDDHLWNCLDKLEDVDIYECGEYYEDADAHIHELIDDLNKELTKRIKELQQYQNKLIGIKLDIEHQRR